MRVYMVLMMIRAYEPTKTIPINKIIKLLSLSTKESYSFNTDLGDVYSWRQHEYTDAVQSDIKRLVYGVLPFKINVKKLNFQFMKIDGGVDWHIDRHTKTCIVLPLKLPKKALFIVEESSRNLKVGVFYRFSDFREHCLDCDAKAKPILLIIEYDT